MRRLVLALLLASPWGSRPAAASTEFGGYGWYIGDPHAHTGVSRDGHARDLGGCGSRPCGALATVFLTAARRGLDWTTLSDHTNGPHAAAPEAWARLHAEVLAADDAGGPLLLPGVELALTTPDGALGHRNVYFFADDAVLEDLTIEDTRPNGESTLVDDCEALGDWLAELDADWGPIVSVPHHTRAATPMPTDWSCFQPTWDAATEVYSSKGNSLWGGYGYDDPPLGAVDDGAAHVALDLGYAPAFFGGTDDHTTRPAQLCSDGPGHPRLTGGLTVAAIPDGEPLSRSALLAAVRARHTLATTGPLLPVLPTYASPRGELGGLGDELHVFSHEPLGVRVRLPPSRAVDAVYAVTPAGLTELTREDGLWTGSLDEPPPWIYVAVRLSGRAWYGAERCEDGGDDAWEWVWTSPSPVVEAQAAWPSGLLHPLDHADGATPACEGGDTGAMLLLLPVFGLRRRRR